MTRCGNCRSTLVETTAGFSPGWTRVHCLMCAANGYQPPNSSVTYPVAERRHTDDVAEPRQRVPS